MNPELQKELLSWLQGLRQAAENGVAFASSQIPQILWEKVVLDRVYYTVEMVIGALLVCAIPVIMYKWVVRWLKPDPHVDKSATFVALMIGGVVSVVLFIGGCCDLSDWYQFIAVWFAPRLYLLNWVRTFVK